ncbi:MAG: Alpha/Beta hydrolase protein [Monoraphidium minutum]|nr:MAG: Alpha/Beta hydrolase protein [Monoraphidium minutum]
MEHCCAAGAPVALDFTPKGAMEVLVGDLNGYMVSGAKPAAIVIVPDIFGVSDEFPQIKQLADRLSAATGYTACVIDTFRGQAWPMSKFPPKPEDNLMGWIQDKGAYDKVSQDVASAVAFLKGRGCGAFAAMGTCWGAAIAMQACGEAGTPFAACAGAHPSLFGRDKELAAACRVPVALVSAKGDPLESVQEVMDGRPELGPKCVFKRMDDMVHGFTAARGDFRDPLVCQRVGEAVQLLSGFFSATLGL